jgi:trans-aconitate methyltransferase
MTDHTHAHDGPAHHGHHDHGENSGHGALFDSEAMAARLELEGEVLGGIVTDAVARLYELCERRGLQVRRVLDIGSGPGVATCALAERFGDARVVAADGSATMLEHVSSRAERLGLASRVETRLVDLPEGVGSLGRADVVWASLVIHHVGNEVDVLRRLRERLERHGLLAVVEFADPMRVVPEDVDLGRPPGLWARIDAAWQAWFEDMRAELPGSTPSADYSAMLAEAGFEVLVDEVLRTVVDPPLDDRARRFARQQLEGAQTRLVSHADPADLAALDALLDESDPEVLGRAGARLSAARRLYVSAVTTG